MQSYTVVPGTVTTILSTCTRMTFSLVILTKRIFIWEADNGFDVSFYIYGNQDVTNDKFWICVFLGHS